MGKDLALFKISAIDDHIGANYHLFYENGLKPPLDGAINMKTLQIEYICFFAQNEKINEKYISSMISLNEDSIRIEESDFSNKIFEKTFQRNSEFLRANGDIFQIINNNQEDIFGYKLNDSNYILFDKNNNFIGVLMKKILPREYDALNESNIV